MCHFRMELNTIETTSFVRHHRNWTAWSLCSDLESFWNTGNLVTMTHPDMQLVFTVLEITDQLVTYHDINFCITELMHSTWLDFTAKLFAHGLQAITNTQYRYTELEYHLWRTRAAFKVNALRSTRQDDTVWIKCTNVFFRH